jgi:hypothetical protein
MQSGSAQAAQAVYQQARRKAEEAAARKERKSSKACSQQVNALEGFAMSHGTALVAARASQDGVKAKATTEMFVKTDGLLTMLNTLPHVGSEAAVDHWEEEFKKAEVAVRKEAEKQRGDENKVNEAVISSLNAMNSAKEDMLVQLRERRAAVEGARYINHIQAEEKAWDRTTHEVDGEISYSITAEKGIQSTFQTKKIKEQNGEAIRKNNCFKISYKNNTISIDAPLGSLSTEDRAGPLKCMIDCAYDNGVRHANLTCSNKEIQLEMMQAVLDNPGRYPGMVVKNIAPGKFIQEPEGSAKVAFDSRPVTAGSIATSAQKNHKELGRQAHAIFGNSSQSEEFISYITNNPEKLHSQLLQHNSDEGKILESLEKDVEALEALEAPNEPLSKVDYELKRQMLVKRFEALEKRHGEPNTYDFDRAQALERTLNNLPDQSEELSVQANKIIDNSLKDMGNTPLSRLCCRDKLTREAAALEVKSPDSLLKQEETAQPVYSP